MRTVTNIGPHSKNNLSLFRPEDNGTAVSGKIPGRRHHSKAAWRSERAKARSLIRSMFQYRNATGRKAPDKARKDAAIAVESVRTAIYGDTGFMEGDLGIEGADLAGTHIGRIRDDESEASGNGGVPVATDERRAFIYPVPSGVACGHGESAFAEVDPETPASFPDHQERDEETSRSCAEIQDVCRAPAAEAVETALDQCFAVGPGRQSVGRHLEIATPEFAYARDLGERRAACAMDHEPVETPALIGGKQGARAGMKGSAVAFERMSHQQARLARRPLDTGGPQCGGYVADSVFNAERLHVR